MVYIKVAGLDQYIVGRLSKDYTHAIAQLYEMQDDDINFIAPSCMIFHNGVEQTSWHIMVNVLAPKKVSCMQEMMMDLIHKVFSDVTINVDIIFSYYSQDDRQLFLNKDYPRFISEDNIVEEDNVEYEECEDDEIFDGNIFQDFEKENSGK